MRSATTVRILALIAVAPLMGADGCDDGGSGAALNSAPMVLQSNGAWSEWSEPVLLEAVNSTALDANPVLSHDERSLYFSSNREGGFGGVDLWAAHRQNKFSDWEAPVNLGAAINTGVDDMGPTISQDGLMLIFVSNRSGGAGVLDLYATRRDDEDSDWGAPFNVGAGVNSAANELSPHFQNKGEGGKSTLYFARGADIFWAPMSKEGLVLGEAAALTEINSTAPDFGPTVSKDGLELMIQSGRTGGLGATDIWVSTRTGLNEAWSTPQNLGAPVNTAASDVAPAISFDGRTLLFTGNAARGGQGDQDIWISTRTPIDN